MTKEMIDTFINNGDIEQFKNKLDTLKIHKLLKHQKITNAIYEVYSILDRDLKKYLCYKLIMTPHCEEYTLLFDDDIKEDVYNEIMKEMENDSSIDRIASIKVRKIISLPEESRKKALDEMGLLQRSVGIAGLKDDQQKKECLKYLESDYEIFMVLASIKDDNFKYDYINSRDFNSLDTMTNSICLFLSSFKNKNIKYNLLLSLLNHNIGEPYEYYATLLEFQNDELTKKLISLLNVEDFDQLRNEGYFDKNDILNNVEQVLSNYFDSKEELDFANEKLSMFLNKNEKYVDSINFNLLNKDIFKVFDENTLIEIFLYPDIQEKIVEIKNVEILYVISKLLNMHIKNDGSSRWDIFFEKIIDRLTSSEYSELINDFITNGSIEFEKLYDLSMQNNDFCICTLEELDNYSSIKKDVCDKLIDGEHIPEKYEYINSLNDIEKLQYALLQKIYGINISDAKRLIDIYGDDYTNLVCNDPKTQETIEQIKTLSKILNERDSKILKSLYATSNNDFTSNYDLIDNEKKFQASYVREYNNTLFNPLNDGTILNTDGDIKLVDAGVNFNILMTSIGAYDRKHIKNYKNIWNNNYDFCASFIRNDMLGTADIPNVCFGFSSMDEDSLILSSSSNISSKARYFNTKSISNIKYYTPDTQINMRGQDNADGKEKLWAYNEMVFKKELNGLIKQPDYILVFRENGSIPNMEKAIKSSYDFGNIPIVIIDKEKCAISELSKINELINEYNFNGNREILEKIKTKIQNNSVSNNYFVEHIGKLLKNLNVEQEEIGYINEPNSR